MSTQLPEPEILALAIYQMLKLYDFSWRGGDSQLLYMAMNQAHKWHGRDPLKIRIADRILRIDG